MIKKLLLGLALLLLPGLAYATDRYVASSCSGQPTPCYTTAQAASNAAVAGDTVYFRAGTYAGFTVTNSGTAGNVITFRNYQSETVTISGSPPDCGTGDGNAMICVEAKNYVTIDGLILDGGRTSTAGIQISHASFINLLNSEIRYANQTGVAIYYAGTNNITVQNSSWHDNVQANIEQSGSFRQGTCTNALLSDGTCNWGAGFVAHYNTSNINVIDNVSYFNHGEGLTIAGSNSVVRGNIVADNWSAQIYCTACTNTIFDRNFVYISSDEQSYPIIPAWGSQNKVNPGALAISDCDPVCGAMSDLTVSNNIFLGGIQRYAVTSDHTDTNGKVYGNTVISNPVTGGGIEWGNQSAAITNLAIRNNAIVQLNDPNGNGAIKITPTPSSKTISNNIYYRSAGERYNYGGSIFTSLASWSSASGDSNSLATNPLLVDASAAPCRLWVDPRGGAAPCSIATLRGQAANYALQSSSPAKDHGVDLGSSYNTDYAGSPRPVPWDIGAYESGGAALPPTLVAAYSFDEGSGLPQDSSGNANHAQSMTGATWTTTGCRYGKCLTFDGSGGGVTVPASASLALSQFTLSAWVKPTVTPPTVFATAVSHGPPGYYYLYSSSESYLCGGIVDYAPGGGYGTGDLHACDNGTLTQNTWYYLTATYDGATIKFYRDGFLQNTSTPSSPLVADVGTFYIGTTAFNENFTGLMDDVRIYSGALTQAQITTDMNTGASVIGPVVLKIPAGATGLKLGGSGVKLGTQTQ